MKKYYYILHGETLQRATVNDRGGFDEPLAIPAGEYLTCFSNDPDLTIEEFKRHPSEQRKD